jgi:hypothetical protein
MGSLASDYYYIYFIFYYFKSSPYTGFPSASNGADKNDRIIYQPEPKSKFRLMCEGGWLITNLGNLNLNEVCPSTTYLFIKPFHSNLSKYQTFVK